MTEELLKWDIYEIRSDNSSLNGVMLRGRIRKFCLDKQINVLVENTTDIKDGVRFAITNGSNPAEIVGYLNKIVEDVSIKLVITSVSNPVLSKLKVNIGI